MARKKRLTAEERIGIVKDILEGKTSQSAASRENGIKGRILSEGRPSSLFENASYRLKMHLTAQTLEKTGKADRMALQSEKKDR